MSLPLNIFEMPPCPHRHGDYCVEATNLLGAEVVVSAPVCNVTCPRNGGPQGGRVINDQERGLWARAMLAYAWGAIVKKIVTRYSKPFEVFVPDVADEVKAAFASITAMPWVRGIGLTGSILSRRGEHRDIDVMLYVNDLRAFIDAKPTLNVPKTIAGLKVDLFASERAATFFMTLDLATLTLYKSGVYNIVAIDPRIVEVVDTGMAEYAAFREPLPESPPPDKTAGRGATVWGMWHRAEYPGPHLIEAARKMLGCGECVAHMEAMIARTPPPYDLDGWRSWVDERHNETNELKRLPKWTREQSRARWGII